MKRLLLLQLGVLLLEERLLLELLLLLHLLELLNLKLLLVIVLLQLMLDCCVYLFNADSRIVLNQVLLLLVDHRCMLCSLVLHLLLLLQTLPDFLVRLWLCLRCVALH